MNPTLSLVELRVLGVLIEKSLAIPANYPMTMNAISAACNQKSNRDPIMQVSDGQVEAALRQLVHNRLVMEPPGDRNARVRRFQHTVESRFGWDTTQRAIMAELMLRGPQTLGELRGHASRLVPLQEVDYVREVVNGLQSTDPPLVAELSRQAGQSSTRFMHLLGGTAAANAAVNAAPDASGAAEAMPAMSGTVAAVSPTPAAAPPIASADTSWSHRMIELEDRVSALESRLLALENRLGEQPASGEGVTS